MPDRNNNNDTSITEEIESDTETRVCWKKEFCLTITLVIIGLIQGTALTILLNKHKEVLPLVTGSSLMLNMILIISLLQRQRK